MNWTWDLSVSRVILWNCFQCHFIILRREKSRLFHPKFKQLHELCFILWKSCHYLFLENPSVNKGLDDESDKEEILEKKCCRWFSCRWDTNVCFVFLCLFDFLFLFFESLFYLPDIHRHSIRSSPRVGVSSTQDDWNQVGNHGIQGLDRYDTWKKNIERHLKRDVCLSLFQSLWPSFCLESKMFLSFLLFPFLFLSLLTPDVHQAGDSRSHPMIPMMPALLWFAGKETELSSNTVFLLSWDFFLWQYFFLLSLNFKWNFARIHPLFIPFTASIVFSLFFFVCFRFYEDFLKKWLTWVWRTRLTVDPFLTFVFLYPLFMYFSQVFLSSFLTSFDLCCSVSFSWSLCSESGSFLFYFFHNLLLLFPRLVVFGKQTHHANIFLPKLPGKEDEISFSLSLISFSLCLSILFPTGFTIFSKEEPASSSSSSSSSSSFMVRSWKEISVSGEARRYSFQDLMCGTKYQIYVVAHNEAGSGPPSNTIVTRTHGTGKNEMTCYLVVSDKDTHIL